MKRFVRAAICAAVLLTMWPTESYASCASRYAACNSNFSRCKASTRAGRWMTVHASIWSCAAVAAGTGAAVGNAGATGAGIACGYVWVYLQRWVESSHSSVCSRQHHSCMQRVRSSCG